MWHIYTKMGEHLSIFESILKDVDAKNVRLHIEHIGSFFELDHLIDICSDEDIIGISSLESLGTSQSDVVGRIQRITGIGIMLVVIAIPATYQFGVMQPMNKAILDATLQGLLAGQSGAGIGVFQNRRGRPRISFPENWEELYDSWNRGELSSGEFLKQSGMKKATFYNLITDYRELERENQKYRKKYG